MLALLSMRFMYAQQTNIDVNQDNIEESILQINATNGITASISGPTIVTLKGEIMPKKSIIWNIAL